MRTPGPETGYVHDIDRERQRQANERRHEPLPGTGRAAEDTVISFFQKNFPNVEVRPATGAEDSDDRMSGGRSIDAVAYRDGKPALGIQVTTTPDPRVRDEKYLAMMRNEPYLRLSEMKPEDPSIPRVLIHLDNNEVVRYLADQNFDQHPKIGEQILTGAINSLKFAAARSKDPADHKRIGELLSMLEREMLNIKKQGKPN